jgi:hypothetical protein
MFTKHSSFAKLIESYLVRENGVTCLLQAVIIGIITSCRFKKINDEV